MVRSKCVRIGLLLLAVVASGCDQGVGTVTSRTSLVVEEQEDQTTSLSEPMQHRMSTAEDASDMKQETSTPLLNPAEANAKSPETFAVLFETTKGPFQVEVNREWAPRGADRLYNLVTIGFFTDVAFFRVIEGFMVQFGISGDPAVSQAWRGARISDDQVKQSNKRGYLTFATSGPNSRTTQMFINYVDNASLDRSGFSPVGRVVQGMSVVDSLYSDYGESAPRGAGPTQDRIQSEGNKYLHAQFSKLDHIKSAAIVQITE